MNAVDRETWVRVLLEAKLHSTRQYAAMMEEAATRNWTMYLAVDYRLRESEAEVVRMRELVMTLSLPRLEHLP